MSDVDTQPARCLCGICARRWRSAGGPSGSSCWWAPPLCSPAMTSISSAWRRRRSRHSLHIAENQVGAHPGLFPRRRDRGAAAGGQRRSGGTAAAAAGHHFRPGDLHPATAFAPDYWSFVAAQILTRIFGYAEEMLCFVVIAEEVAAGARGWANGTLTAFYFLGAGVAAGLFGAVNILPYGWRALYVIGAVPIFLVGLLRRRLPETKRFQTQGEGGLKKDAALELLRDLAREYPGRIATVIAAASAYRLCDFLPHFHGAEISAGGLSLQSRPGDPAPDPRRSGRTGPGDRGRAAVRPRGAQARGDAHGGVGRRQFFPVFQPWARLDGARRCGCWAGWDFFRATR